MWYVLHSGLHVSRPEYNESRKAGPQPGIKPGLPWDALGLSRYTMAVTGNRYDLW